MDKITDARDLPEWFSLDKYSPTADFDLADWHRNLDKRQSDYDYDHLIGRADWEELAPYFSNVDTRLEKSIWANPMVSLDDLRGDGDNDDLKDEKAFLKEYDLEEDGYDTSSLNHKFSTLTVDTLGSVLGYNPSPTPAQGAIYECNQLRSDITETDKY